MPYNETLANEGICDERRNLYEKKASFEYWIGLAIDFNKHAKSSKKKGK